MSCFELANDLIGESSVLTYIMMLNQSQYGFGTDFHSKMRDYEDRAVCYSKIEESMSNEPSANSGEREYAIGHLLEFGSLLADSVWKGGATHQANAARLQYEAAASLGHRGAIEALFRRYTRTIQDEWMRKYSSPALPDAALLDPTRIRRAVSWMLGRAEAGDPRAQSIVGHLYEHGMGVSQNFELATSWYERAAKAGFDEGRKALERLRRVRAN
ncbi:MAG: sel1 repeat family protein [Kiloniellales bacterium]|nr:sel1 repeat family protein [Kiloniellales bacterium]